MQMYINTRFTGVNYITIFNQMSQFDSYNKIEAIAKKQFQLN